MTPHLSEEEWNERVRAHPELAAMPQSLRDAATEQQTKAGERLYAIGDRPQFMLFVTAGELRLTRRAQNGAEVILQRSASGFVAEASLETSRYHCDIVAAQSTRLLRFPIGCFREALREDAAFQAAWMSRLAQEVRKLRAQCERLSLHGAAERIEHYIEAEGQGGRLELRQSRKSWAAELGLTHEALYRALATMVRTGRLRTEMQGDRFVLFACPRKH